MNKIVTIEIEDLSGKVIFTHSDEYNCFQKTLEKAVIEDYDLKNANFMDINVTACSLRDADFKGCSFKGSNFKGTDFKGCDLRNADMKNADLRNTNLTYAKLWQTDLRGANLRGAKYTESQIALSFTDKETLF